MAALVRSREVSAVEIVEAHLRRVERINPRLNAVITLAPDALERASEIDAALARGDDPGPLAGVPVTVKETIETANLRTTYGMRAFAENVPREDAPAVARLRRAGAIILGKSNASELALDYSADNPVFGRTNNPFDERLTPGGSSGGCAAAVSACLAAAGLGSDLSGSLRIPAHFCGVAGLRPTAGRVPGGGHLPPVTGLFAAGASLGPIARRVEDLSLLFDVLSHDGARAAGDAGLSVADSLQLLRGLRVAWYADDGTVPVSSETRSAVESAARALSDAGLSVEESRPPHVGRAGELWPELFSNATSEFLRATFAGREETAGPFARFLLGRAGADPVADVEKAWAERESMRAELLRWMEDRPLLLAPVGAVPAQEHGTRKVAPAGGESFGVFRAFGYAQAFNVLDLPAAAVRAGWTAEGLPVGVQVVARPGREREALAGARVIEHALGGWQGVPDNLSNPRDIPV